MEKFNCGSTSLLQNVSMQTVNDREKLRIRSKYFLGSCAVQIVFLSGPTNGWTSKAKIDIETKIRKGVNYLRTYTLQSTPALTLPSMNFVFASSVIESYCNTNPTDCFTNGDKIQVNVKKFLADQGYFSGNLNSISLGWNENDTLQSLYDYNNDQRDDANTDWSFLVFVIPNVNTIPMTEVAWASEKLGLMVITDMKNDEDWVVSHETGHLFGPLDKSAGNCPNPPDGAGMYKVKNNICGTVNAYDCFMGERSRKTVSDVTLNQLSLQKNSAGEYIAPKDFSYNKYTFTDQSFKIQNGIICTGDVLRAGRKVYIRVSGSSKMNDWYNSHGPEGDAKTIVGNDHMLPNHAFSCVIGRFISMDGSKVSPWFEVGKGDKWFFVPFRSYFVWGINDKLGNFSDNSGNMTVEIFVKLTDQLGSAWDYKMNKTESIEQIVESSETKIINQDDYTFLIDSN